MGERTEGLRSEEFPDPRTEDELGPNRTSGLIAPGTFSGTAAPGAPYSEGDPELFTNEFAAGAPEAEVPDFGDTETDTDGELERSRAQIEQTRAEMSSTIDAIQEKLSPHHIAQQAKNTVKEATVGKAQTMVSNAGDTASELVTTAGESARGFGSTIVETIKSNPVPAAIAGIGLGWLFVSGRKESTQEPEARGYSPRYGAGQQDYYGASGYSGESYGNESSLGSRLNSTGDRVGNLAGQAQESAGQVAGQVQAKAGQVAGGVQDTAGQLAGNVQDTAGQLASSAQYGVQRAQSGFQQALQSNPLAVGMAAVAIGAAIGLSIPGTDKENQLLGETRDGMMQQAQQVVQDKAQQVQTVAQEAMGAAKDAAQQSADKQGLTQH